MNKRRYAELAKVGFSLAILASLAWFEVRRFRDFHIANPGSDYWAFLADRWPATLVAALIFVGIVAVVHWWRREPNSGNELSEFHETESR